MGMYVSKNLFDKSCSYIDLDDRQFFMTAIERAIEALPEVERSSISKDALKRATPIAHISKLSKQTKAEDVVDRRYVHSDRARRSFLMGDVDFDAGQETESKRLRAKLIGLANRHRTPILIYPTVSAPGKPRFRFVFLAKRLMNETQYHQAMSWLYQQVGEEPTDASDLRMSANRNLPVFDDESQLPLIYSTFPDESREPLDNSLWKDMPKPKKASFRLSDEQRKLSSERHSAKLDSRKLLEGAELMCGTPVTKSYDKFWLIVASLAASVVCGGCDEQTALSVLDKLAEAGEDEAQVRRWKADNPSLLYSHINRLAADRAQLEMTRPLLAWSEFSNARDPRG